MESKIIDGTVLPEWQCPIFGKVIDAGLCWEISNIGDDSLQLAENETPPCGWTAAHAVCAQCPRYQD